jgi:hypothetical protein
VCAFVHKQTRQRAQNDRKENFASGRQVTEVEPWNREKRRRRGPEAAILWWYQEILCESQHHQQTYPCQFLLGTHATQKTPLDMHTRMTMKKTAFLMLTLLTFLHTDVS